MDRIPLRLDNGKAVGRIENGTAFLRVRRSRHFFRRLGGYSIDSAVLAQIERSSAGRIEFLDEETGELAQVSPRHFREHARPVDFGYGKKWVCPERFYNREVAGQGLLFDTCHGRA